MIGVGARDDTRGPLAPLGDGGAATTTRRDPSPTAVTAALASGRLCAAGTGRALRAEGLAASAREGLLRVLRIETSPCVRPLPLLPLQATVGARGMLGGPPFDGMEVSPQHHGMHPAAAAPCV
jgi:hypothetical protein